MYLLPFDFALPLARLIVLPSTLYSPFLLFSEVDGLLPGAPRAVGGLTRKQAVPTVGRKRGRESRGEESAKKSMNSVKEKERRERSGSK